MVSASKRVESAALLTAMNSRSRTTSGSAESFAKQLDTTVKAEAGTAKGASRLGGIVNSAGGRNSGSRQVSDAVSTNGGTTKPTPFTSGAGTAADATISDIPTMLGMGPVPGTAPVPVPVATQQPAWAQMTEGDAYWAQQPAAVQALRYMPEGDAKTALALSLSGQGYTIDTQIMVMGWDPQMTMAARAGYGYTWVPAFGQSPISVQPGITDPYMASNYDPANPPPGSIKVSTDFAIGMIQNPLVHVSTATS